MKSIRDVAKNFKPKQGQPEFYTGDDAPVKPNAPAKAAPKAKSKMKSTAKGGPVPKAKAPSAKPAAKANSRTGFWNDFYKGMKGK